MWAFCVTSCPRGVNWNQQANQFRRGRKFRPIFPISGLSVRRGSRNRGQSSCARAKGRKEIDLGVVSQLYLCNFIKEKDRAPPPLSRSSSTERAREDSYLLSRLHLPRFSRSCRAENPGKSAIHGGLETGWKSCEAMRSSFSSCNTRHNRG